MVPARPRKGSPAARVIPLVPPATSFLVTQPGPEVAAVERAAATVAMMMQNKKENSDVFIDVCLMMKYIDIIDVYIYTISLFLLYMDVD